MERKRAEEEARKRAEDLKREAEREETRRRAEADVELKVRYYEVPHPAHNSLALSHVSHVPQPHYFCYISHYTVCMG